MFDASNKHETKSGLTVTAKSMKERHGQKVILDRLGKIVTKFDCY